MTRLDTPALPGAEYAGAGWEAAMRAGDFAGAWRINDRMLAGRFGMPDDPALPYHRRFVWDGTPPDGRDVLVRCYHGLGDTLQFVRYLTALRRRAAAVTLEVQADLLPVLAGLAGADRLVPFRVSTPLPPAECDVEVMELAHMLRLRPDRMLAPYLTMPQAQVARARARLGAGVLVGLCPRAGGWDPERSVPAAALAAAAPSGTRLVNLHPEPAAGPDWANPDERLSDIASTAALVCAVDLVITVDTMVAHLAGALGRPVWVLLKRVADWRWGGEECSDCPWYPTMRLYRQANAGDWTAPLAAVARDLVERAKGLAPNAA